MAREPDNSESGAAANADFSPEDEATVLTSPADVASAGRSCMAILLLAAVIVLLLCVWIGYRSTGGG